MHSISWPRPRGHTVLRGVATTLSAVAAVILLLGVLIQVWELLLLAVVVSVVCWVLRMVGHIPFGPDVVDPLASGGEADR